MQYSRWHSNPVRERDPQRERETAQPNKGPTSSALCNLNFHRGQQEHDEIQPESECQYSFRTEKHLQPILSSFGRASNWERYPHIRG